MSNFMLTRDALFTSFSLYTKYFNPHDISKLTMEHPVGRLKQNKGREKHLQAVRSLQSFPCIGRSQRTFQENMSPSRLTGPQTP